ncbi:Ankyrin repeat family protein [Forsythia ovata]|uniref:Ankyrin repeat family protein n=1 Tax=Forsythia ovata TaxID=205694 RepID=A0ABD1S192_9LAMI
MAVPGDRRNGVLGGDEEEEDATLFEEEGVEFAEEDNNDHFDIPLHLHSLVAAAESDDLNVLRQALDNFDGSIDEPVEDGDTHLTSNLEAKDEDGASPMHDACTGGYIEVFQILLNSANDPNYVKRMLETVDVEGDTPLHHAARGEYVNVIRLLLAYGASPTTTNMYMKTPVSSPILEQKLGESWKRLLVLYK